jgi:uncharacterized membrane protein
MSLGPLFEADLQIQIHAFSAMAAVVLGALVLWRRKGTRLHKVLGRAWVALMLVTATSALFIHEMRMVGPLSPIHLFSLFTYAGVAEGLYAIIVKRDVRRHAAQMQGLYAGALILAGAFTFLPGRRMHTVLFGPDAGWAQSLMIIVPMLVVAALIMARLRRRGAAQPA